MIEAERFDQTILLYLDAFARSAKKGGSRGMYRTFLTAPNCQGLSSLSWCLSGHLSDGARLREAQEGMASSAQIGPDFSTVTELGGDDVTREQVERLCHRYYWAGAYCEDKDVLEVACGTGPGLGYLASKARSLQAGDITAAMVASCINHYGDRVPVSVMDAARLPQADRSLDVVILFEAIYYLPDASAFLAECRRVLRPGGTLLIATANKDLSDFNPSPYARTYFGAVELARLLRRHGLQPSLFAYGAIARRPLPQRLLGPVKQVAVALGLLPKTMAGKRLLKRLVFGELVRMPAEIVAGMHPYVAPQPVPEDRPDRQHQVIYCSGRLP